MPKTAFEELFTDADVIYAYTDSDALRDGVLVAWDASRSEYINGKPINRLTASVWAATAVDIAGAGVITDITPVRKLIASVLSDPSANYDGDWYIAEIEGQPIWCVPNEVGGYTMMFPEDN